MPRHNFISLEGIDDDYDEDDKKKQKTVWNINSSAATLVKLLFFLFALFMMIASDTGIRLLSKLSGAVEEGQPTLYGHAIQGVVMSVLFVFIYGLIANNII